MIRVRFLQGTSVSFRYFHQDHLGSIAVITNESGALAEPRDAYDAWGKRRNFNGTDDVAGTLTSQTPRGFTGEEMLASVGLVHLNGRVYDPYIARMTSADPIIGDPLNGQTWNRYSYVWNNPLAYTDPTGYCPACIGTVNPQPPSPSGVMQLAESVFKIAVAAICTVAPGCQPFLPLVVAVTSAYFAGVHSGKLGVALKAGLIAGATALAFKGVGNLTGGAPGFDDPGFLPNVAGHALVGCGSSVASGGKCGPGALSAAVTAFAGPIINKLPFEAAVVANSTLGGFASVAGGGKFVNGAVTGAFGYLFNNRLHCTDIECPPKIVAPLGGELLGAGAAGLAIQTAIKDWLNSDSVPASAAGDQSSARVHGNSSDSMRGTEVYYLINNATGAIDKIGITSYPDERYSQAYLAAENVRYVPQAQYQWRKAAMVDENIRLTFYLFEYGQLPRLNQVTR